MEGSEAIGSVDPSRTAVRISKWVCTRGILLGDSNPFIRKAPQINFVKKA